MTIYGQPLPEPRAATDALWRRLNEVSEDLDLLERRYCRLEKRTSRLAWASLAFVAALAVTALYFTGGGW